VLQDPGSTTEQKVKTIKTLKFKKMRKIYIAAILIAAVAFLSQSCSKDEQGIKEDKRTMARTGDIDTTEAKIIRFIERMDLVRENPQYPGSENWNYSEDSAVWYIEAALNYKYAGQWLYNGSEVHADLYTVDSSFSQINTNSNGIDFNIVELQDAYDIFSNALELQYQNTLSESKFFVISDIINKGKTNNVLSLMQFSVIGKANQLIPQNGWIWGQSLGDCSGNNVGKDAADIIQSKVNSSRPDLSTTTSYASYVSVVVYPTDFIGNPAWIYPENVPLIAGSFNPTPFAGYMLFESGVSATNQPCVDDVGITWYRDNILSIEQANLPINKIPVFSHLQDNIVYSMNGNLGIHKLQIRYGEIHLFTINNSTKL
jgi:hypothetical protein